ncbi:MAG: hypothetical protein C5B60_06100, partial [Chloroflexi bacterium]
MHLESHNALVATRSIWYTSSDYGALDLQRKDWMRQRGKAGEAGALAHGFCECERARPTASP